MIIWGAVIGVLFTGINTYLVHRAQECRRAAGAALAATVDARDQAWGYSQEASRFCDSVAATDTAISLQIGTAQEAFAKIVDTVQTLAENAGKFSAVAQTAAENAANHVIAAREHAEQAAHDSEEAWQHKLHAVDYAKKARESAETADELLRTKADLYEKARKGFDPATVHYNQPGYEVPDNEFPGNIGRR